MARGRMINKKISTSKRVNDLPTGAALLFTWLISHLDCDGIFHGSAKMVKSLVFPRQKFTEKQVEQWLILMEKSKNIDGLPLIYRYFIDGEQFLWMPGFNGEQVGLRKDKEHPDFKLPLQTDKIYGIYTEILRKYSVKNPENFPPKRREVEEKRREVEENTENPPQQQTFKTEDFQEIITTYEDNIGMPTPIIADKIKATLGEYPFDWIKEAIIKSTKKKKRSWGYVEGILKGWKRDGYKTDGSGSQNLNHSEVLLKQRYKYVN